MSWLSGEHRPHESAQHARHRVVPRAEPGGDGAEPPESGWVQPREAGGRSHLRIFSMVAAWLLAGSSAMLGAPALADSAPINPNDPKTPVTVTADSLPTAQHDGVAWQAITLGNTVYVAGKFNNARPFGASAGTQLVSRRNLLAFD